MRLDTYNKYANLELGVKNFERKRNNKMDSKHNIESVASAGEIHLETWLNQAEHELLSDL